MKEKSMILITASWKDKRSFKMIPTNKDCPYNECLFDPISKVLAIVSKEHKPNFHMMPMLDNYGGIKRDVPNNLREQGREYREERVQLDTYYEYYIQDKEEMFEFIKSLAFNADTYDYKQQVENAFAVIDENPK